MATFKNRLPSKEEAVLLFGTCAFAVYSWLLLRYFWMVPGWNKYMPFWDIASALAYGLAYALIESVLVFLTLVLFRVVLSTPLVREQFVSKASTLVLVNALWALVLYRVILSRHMFVWTIARYLFCAALYLTSVGVSWALVHRCQGLAEQIEAFVDRLTVFLYVYVPLGALGFLVVIARNVL